MADRKGNNAGVYRSVSFKKLGSGSSCRRRAEEQKEKSGDLEAVGVSSAAAEASPAARNVSASRKVSKISATAAASLPTADSKRASSAFLPSVSPSIRQLTEKFSSSSSSFLRAPSPGRTQGSPAKPPHDEEEEDQDSHATSTESLADAKKFHSGTDSVSVSDSERISERWAFCLSTDSSSSYSGKRDYSQINARAAVLKKSLTTDEEEEDVRGVPPPCKSHRSYLHGDLIIPSHSDRWPSVTKIRQLFDEKGSNALPLHKTNTCESLKAAGSRHLPQSCTENAPVSDRSGCSANEANDLTLHGTRETSCYDADFCSKTQQCPKDEGLTVETNQVSDVNTLQSSSSFHTGRYQRINSSLYRSQSPSTESEAACRIPKTSGSTSDPKPDLQPCPTLFRSGSASLDASSCSSSEQQPSERGRRDIQGVGLPRDSLHSSHSFSKAPAPTTSSTSSAPAPDKAINSCSSTVALSSDPATVCSSVSSRWRLNSADKEEAHTRRRRGHSSDPKASGTCRGGERTATDRGGSYLSRSKNGWWGANIIGRSSGSEEDSPTSLGPHCRETVRRRSLRKKKKVSGVAVESHGDYNDHDGESEDSDSDTALTMDHLGKQQNTGEVPGRIHRSHSAREHGSHSYRAKVQHWERITSPVMPSTLPGVSRVSKVNIPPFISSPAGSHCSSRYSSTETLKEESQGSCVSRSANVFLNRSGAEGSTSRTASSSVLSKTYHGNFTMYRSPSFGHGDNFSRAPFRVRPKLMPIVTPTLNAPPGDGGGSSEIRSGEAAVLQTKTWRGDEDNNIKLISTSNPDITSDTMNLLSLLKSGLPGLKVRRTNEEDRSGAVEGSASYRKGSGPRGRTVLPLGHRPSLKDLTATLRRTKSFTYSDKPTRAKCYLTGGTTKRSASEQQLDLGEDKDEMRMVLSDREVESDGGDFRVGRGLKTRNYGLDDDDEYKVMPTPFQERCAQEARQVIQDICQMCTREDDDDYASVNTTRDELEGKSLQVKTTSEEKGKAGDIKDETRTALEAESENAKNKDKHEQERESSRRQRSEQSMQLEKLNTGGTECWENLTRQSREQEDALQKCGLEERMLYDRSLDELSGHESSLTDEGIVTEPETGPSDLSERLFLGSAGVNLGSRLGREVLVQPDAGWKQSVHDGESFKHEGTTMTENSLRCSNHLSKGSLPCLVTLPVCMTQNDNFMEESDAACINTGSEGMHINNAVLQGLATTSGGVGGLYEAPATPGSSRRRRKFSPPDNNNTSSESSNGIHADSTITAVGNGESTVYRSLSDPMPQRRCSSVEEGSNNFSSVDSNLLGSLSVKGGGGGATEASSTSSVSEYKGSVASDLSVYSDGGVRDDGIQDYSGVIRNIVAEPGAMNRLVTDDHSNGKAPKKKSFSDPSRRSDASLLSQNDPQFKGQTDSPQPISELDQSGQIPPSSSEPILSEQREELWESESKPTQIQVKISDCSHHSDNPEDEDDVICHGGEEEVQKFNFDIRLAEVFSPRKVRRPTRKRPNRLAFCPDEDQLEPLEMDSCVQEDPSNQSKLVSSPPVLSLKSKLKPKHVRHDSEPATFIPISPPPQLQPLKEVDSLTVQSTVEPLILDEQVGDVASPFQDMTRKHIPCTHKTNAEARPVQGSSDEAHGLLTTSGGPGEISNIGLTESAPQKGVAEDSPPVPVPQRTKPKVVSFDFVLGFLKVLIVFTAV